MTILTIMLTTVWLTNYVDFILWSFFVNFNDNINLYNSSLSPSLSFRHFFCFHLYIGFLLSKWFTTSPNNIIKPKNPTVGFLNRSKGSKWVTRLNCVTRLSSHKILPPYVSNLFRLRKRSSRWNWNSMSWFSTAESSFLEYFKIDEALDC